MERRLQDLSSVSADAEEGTLLLSHKHNPVPWYYIPKRFIMLALMTTASTIVYILRTNLSVAIIAMQKEYNWTPSQEGILHAAFFAGYVIPQVPTSYIATKIGTKRILGAGLLFTGIFSMILPFVAFNFGLLLICRCLTGFSEAVTFPLLSILIKEWAGPKEKSTFVAMSGVGGQVGTIIALMTTSPLITMVGWRYMFLITGVPAVVWAIIWQIIGAERPILMKGIHQYEVDLIASAQEEKKPQQDEEERQKKMSAKELYHFLLTNKRIWAVIISSFCHGWGFYVLLVWIPTYMQKVLNFPFESLGLYAVLPYIAASFLGFAGGRGSDFLWGRGIPLTTIRRSFTFIGHGLAGFYLFAICFAETVPQSLTCMILAVGTAAFTSGGQSANVQDLSPENTGVIYGIVNTFASIPGIIGVYLTGWMLETFQSWSYVFGLAAMLYVVSCLCFFKFGHAHRIL